MTVLEDDVADALADYRFGAVILFGENIKETEEASKDKLVKTLKCFIKDCP